MSDIDTLREAIEGVEACDAVGFITGGLLRGALEALDRIEADLARKDAVVEAAQRLYEDDGEFLGAFADIDLETVRWLLSLVRELQAENEVLRIDFDAFRSVARQAYLQEEKLRAAIEAHIAWGGCAVVEWLRAALEEKP